MNNNAFARVLYFYFLYFRAKINCSDLQKIAKKYGSKPCSLLLDLGKKYAFTLPDSVADQDIIRICASYSVPVEFMRLLNVDRLDSYDARLDYYSSSFDPNLMLSTELVMERADIPVYDNLTIVNFMFSGVNSTAVSRSATLNRNVKDHVVAEVVKPVKEKEMHLLETIADYAVKPKRKRNETSPTPLLLLQNCLVNKIRVRIIIRRNSR